MSNHSDPTTPTRAEVFGMLPVLDCTHADLCIRLHTLPVGARRAEET